MMSSEAEKLAKAYLSFSQSVEGQLIIKDLRDKFFERTLVDRSSNTNEILLNVGMREVVVYILRQIESWEYENGRNT